MAVSKVMTVAHVLIVWTKPSSGTRKEETMLYKEKVHAGHANPNLRVTIIGSGHASTFAEIANTVPNTLPKILYQSTQPELCTDE